MDKMKHTEGERRGAGEVAQLAPEKAILHFRDAESLEVGGKVGSPPDVPLFFSRLGRGISGMKALVTEDGKGVPMGYYNVKLHFPNGRVG